MFYAVSPDTENTIDTATFLADETVGNRPVPVLYYCTRAPPSCPSSAENIFTLGSPNTLPPYRDVFIVSGASSPLHRKTLYTQYIIVVIEILVLFR